MNDLTRHMRSRIAAAVLCVVAVVSQACAQSAPETLIVAQPLVHKSVDAINGCGVRLTGGATHASGPSDWFDVSFNLFRSGVALVQSIAYEIRPSKFDGSSRPARVPVQSTWMTTGDHDAKLGENIEQRETLVYRLGTDEVLTMFEAVARGQPVVWGIKRWGQNEALVYTGTPTLTSEARDQIADCFASLAQ